jgi:crotonobetainyl-CoA:carnitine CoA-transferase CaiB-like acyl-CoA transferase
MLGDVGADIIKIEPPGGSRSRIAPYYKDILIRRKAWSGLLITATKGA